MSNAIRLATIVSVIGYITTTGFASVIGGSASGTFHKIAPPSIVGNNNFNDNDILYAFDEKQAEPLTSDLTLDIAAAGVTSPLPSGTYVSSHYVFYDPQATLTITGQVTFSDTILGIITETATLNSSDYLGSDTTTYASPSLRGLESVDSVSITSPTTIELSFQASSPGDYIRVLTVPEPTTLALLAAGLIGLQRRRAMS